MQHRDDFQNFGMCDEIDGIGEAAQQHATRAFVDRGVLRIACCDPFYGGVEFQQ